MALARVGRLATTNADGSPHLVPCCFVLTGDGTIYTAVDDVKPKSSRRLRRLDNIGAQPRVSLLVDDYTEDWSALWWIRLDGGARVAPTGSDETSTAGRLLAAKYDQYRRRPPPVPVIAIDVDRWRAWP